ncbi:MAG: LysR family transcriptional regulator, partial [Oceanobacter sp.]
MDLRQLRYFIVVAEEGNIGRAALRLHISQPPLTRQIQHLEDHLGVKLFVRTPKGVELTDAGHLLLEEARNIRSLVA